ncbi:MAG TPA: heavy metal translocating P-type ATPase [Methylocella sp.]|nr:heavy metal translocating P-type ATPase [Methylocella sp.]
MRISVRHRIPGRIRLHVPALREPSALAGSIAVWLRRQAGIKSVRVNHACACMIIEHDPAFSSALDALLAFLARSSFDELQPLVCKMAREASAPASAGQSDAATRPNDDLRVYSDRWPLWLPTLSLGLALSINPLSAAVNVPLILLNSTPSFRRAWRSWRRQKRLNVDFLDCLATVASISQGHLFTGSLITWLIRLGDRIRDLTAAGSKRAAGELLEFQSKSAWLLENGNVRSIPAAELKEGQTVVVYPGEMVPVDGEILQGEALVDQKTITGEGLPVLRSAGEAVFAATVLREGQLTLRATRVGTDTTAGQIARLVDSAPVGDTRMQNYAERFADRLVPPTLALAFGSAALTADFNRFLSLVIIDYGTGIRVAAPTAMLASMTHAARCGILVKSGGHMEKLAEVDTILFDKTGTLSHGVPHVVEVLSYEKHLPPGHLLALAVAVETHLQHPVAEALREKLCEFHVPVPQCEEIRYRVGLGVEGQANGRYLHVGSERFLRQSDIKIDHIATDRATFDRRGCSSVYIAIDGKLAGLVAYEDRIRPESRDVMETLRGMNIRDTIMLTGDNARVAEAVARRLGVTRHYADMLPSDKAAVIQDLQRRGRTVAMVGDGINDAPALCFADVGIAMRHGAEVAHESADVVLMKDSLWKLVQAIDVSRGAVRLIGQNYVIVAALNTIALGLALPGGLISPSTTAVLSNGSAIVASLNGMRPLLRQRRK